MRTESNLLALLEELSSIKWDVVRLCEVRRLGKNIVEFYGVSERVASVTIKLNNRYSLQIVQVYTPTCSHSDEEIVSFYEDVHLASKRVKPYFTIIMGDCNAKIGKKTGDTIVVNHDMGTRNERGQMLVDFAEA
ncbi:craniofacial development protein 2-like [Penaeus vannamei]|uniref:craniofacial development protein 2-like n=1 Tax=Penaeus vannamei TaxID=6689 RepID=UPI00387FA327